jgi:dihydrofolate reductase
MFDETTRSIPMRNVLIFMMISLDGYYAGLNDEIDWHVTDEEFNEFANQQLDEVDTLIFGRRTYEGMASYWTTPLAMENDPMITRQMNAKAKIVFSRTLTSADWQNTRLIKDNIAEEIGKLRQQPGKDLIIFGSSDLAVSFINQGLIDEFRIIVNPVVLGRGKSLFEGADASLKLKLIRTRQFASGNVLHYYQPDRKA